MEQLLTHLFADFFLQSDWMAMNKSKRSWPCFVHVLIYTSCFLILTTSWKALLIIGSTHFIIDRFSIIIRKLIWFKNHLGPNFVFVPYNKCDATGYYDNVMNEVNRIPSEKWDTYYLNRFEDQSDSPLTKITDITYFARLNYVTVWLYIVTDNLFHLTINFLALKYLS